MDIGSNRVTNALQDAYSGLVRAVELGRRRSRDSLDIAAVVSEIHELRTIMSAAAQMMRSFDLARYGDLVTWGPAGEPDNPDGLTPRQYVEAADADVGDAYEHLRRAAASLTTARRRLAALN